MTDHAGRIDDIRRRAATSFGLVEAETDSLRTVAATAERDTRTVMQKVQENDDQRKTLCRKDHHNDQRRDRCPQRKRADNVE